METSFNGQWTAAEVLAAFPQSAAAFMALKTDCVGCHLDRFCTLEEVAAAYEIPLEQLLSRLHEAIQTPNEE
ncbi:MAG: disulfide oxidoreductase [Bacteroidetes bacterium]|nr:disulfide oxidoreductase [Bacteroidota bacterium]